MFPETCYIFSSCNGKFQVSQGNDPLGRCDTSTTKNKEILARVSRSYLKIPQVDGPIPDPYDDVLSTPNVCITAFVIFLKYKDAIKYAICIQCGFLALESCMHWQSAALHPSLSQQCFSIYLISSVSCFVKGSLCWPSQYRIIYFLILYLVTRNTMFHPAKEKKRIEKPFHSLMHWQSDAQSVSSSPALFWRTY
jgi:hypothetical protein